VTVLTECISNSVSLLNMAGMYICSQSGELVHPIHLKHLVDEEEEVPESVNNGGAPIAIQDEEKGGGLERGTPVHRG
jgi:hypothetical protein